jgi:hypothetical protein
MAPVLTSIALASPKTVCGTLGTTGKVTLVNCPAAGEVVNLTSSNTKVATVPATVTVGKDNTASFNVTTFGVSADTKVTITASFGPVTKQDTLTVMAPVLTSVALTPPKTVCGTIGTTGKVTLSCPAIGQGAVVKLHSDNKAAVVFGNGSADATVTVPTGQTPASFNVTTFLVNTDTKVTITAAFGSVTKQDTLTVMAPVLMTSVALPQKPVCGGDEAAGTITLINCPAAGAVVNLKSSDPNTATVPATVTASRDNIAAFTITTKLVDMPADFTDVDIIATFGPGTAHGTLRVMKYVKLTFPPLVHSKPDVGTITLCRPAGGNGEDVMIESDSPQVYIRNLDGSIGPVHINPGADHADFIIFPQYDAPNSTTITATYRRIKFKKTVDIK